MPQVISPEKQRKQNEARRALLIRQSRREKSGFYAGQSVAAAMGKSRSRVGNRKVDKGKPFCRILVTDIVGDRELQFHATKGWRSYRATP